MHTYSDHSGARALIRQILAIQGVRLAAPIVIGGLAPARAFTAAPAAWQLLDDGDPSPGNWPLVYDTSRQRAILDTPGTTNTDNVDGPSIHWELVGNDWERVWLPEPTPRGHGAACATFDSARGVVVLFGAGPNRNETWEFNGSAWTLRTPPSSPPGRALCGLAYDPVNLRTVLFGGTTNGSNGFSDTWEWDGTAWIQEFPSSGPAARGQGSMTFDGQSQRILLFGGRINSAALNDTWLYDAHRHRWTQQSPTASPQNRGGVGLAYDPIRNRDVLFGGESAVQDYGDTWEWDGKTWAQIGTPNAPSARKNFHLVFDTLHGTVLGFGGGPDGGWVNDTWTYNGDTWTRIAVSGLPPPREAFGMAYDANVGGLVVFGGDLSTTPFPNQLNDTWHYVDGIWSLQSTSGVPSDAEGFPVAFDAQMGGLRGFSGWGQTGRPNDSDVHRYQGAAPSWTSIPTNGPPPRAWQTWSYSTGLGGIVMFGGQACCVAPNSLYEASDTWLLSGDTWTLLVPSGFGPPKRTGGAAAYDSLRDRVLMYGGSPDNAITPLRADTWSYSQGSWHLLQDPSPPGGRSWNGMTYDQARDVVVLYGSGPIMEGVTWEFDGTTWNASPTPFQPDSTRAFFQMAYDPVKEVTYLFSGRDLVAQVYFNDLWAYGSDPDGDGIVGKLDNCPNATNANQANVDGDLYGDACDCAPSDAFAWSLPQPVNGLTLSGQATTTLTWADQSGAVGPGVHYDTASGDLIQLHSSGSFAGAACVGSQSAVTSASDARPILPGAGYWYLVRARNVCGIGSYGATGADAASPCP